MPKNRKPHMRISARNGIIRNRMANSNYYTTELLTTCNQKLLAICNAELLTTCKMQNCSQHTYNAKLLTKFAPIF